MYQLIELRSQGQVDLLYLKMTRAREDLHRLTLCTWRSHENKISPQVW